MMKEFKDFAMRGNVVDMSVGIVIGAAFGKIVSALVEGVVMPPLGMLMGAVDFTDLKLVIQEGTEETAEVAIMYGQFLQTVIDFTIVAFAIFLVIKAMNSMKKKEEAAPAAPSRQEVLLEEIRDALKKGGTKAAVAKKPAVKKSPVKPAARKTVAKKTSAKKSTAKKVPVKKASSKKK